MRRDVTSTYGLLKQSHHQKKVYCEVRNCKQTLKFLRVLRDNSLIYGYSIVPQTNKVFVYLRYFRNRPALKHIKLYSKPGHRRPLNFRVSSYLLSQSNPGSVAVVGSPKKADIVDAYLVKSDKDFHYANRTYGELLCLAW